MPERLPSYARRRASLKASVYADLEEVVRAEAWGSWLDHAMNLGFRDPDETLGKVMDEIAEEMSRRIVRLGATDA